jgi:hypothetical protein
VQRLLALTMQSITLRANTNLNSLNSHSDLSPKREGPVDCASKWVQPLSLSLRTKSLPLLYSHTCLTAWSVFQDGEKKTISSASRAQVTDLGPTMHTTDCVITPLKGVTSQKDICTQSIRCWPARDCRASAASNQRNTIYCNTRFLRFPFSR